MFLLNGIPSSVLSLVGLAGLMFFLLGGFTLAALVAFAVLQRNKRTATLVASASEIVRDVDFSDGLDDKELAIIKKLFADQKQAELKESVKEKLVKVSGYETE